MNDTAKRALELANELQAGADDPMWADHCEMPKLICSESALMLRSVANILDAQRSQGEIYETIRDYWSTPILSVTDPETGISRLERATESLTIKDGRLVPEFTFADERHKE